MDYTLFTEKPIYIVGLIILMVWSIIWKGLALWKAARSNDNVWFIAMMVLNTSGILEIIYYYFISKRGK